MKKDQHEMVCLSTNVFAKTKKRRYFHKESLEKCVILDGGSDGVVETLSGVVTEHRKSSKLRGKRDDIDSTCSVYCVFFYSEMAFKEEDW